MIHFSAPPVQAYAIRTVTPGVHTRTATLQLAGGGSEGGDTPGTSGSGTPAPVEMVSGAEWVQPIGLFCNPPVSPRLEGFGMELGDEVIIFAVLDKSGNGDSAPSFSDLAVGGTRLYSPQEKTARIDLQGTGSAVIQCKAGQSVTVLQEGAGGASITINPDGSIAVTAASGKTTTINGGTLNVARETDTLNVGTLTATAGPYPVVFAYVAGTASESSLPTPPPGGVTLSGVILKGTGNTTIKG